MPDSIKNCIRVAGAHELKGESGSSSDYEPCKSEEWARDKIISLKVQVDTYGLMRAIREWIGYG